MASGDPLIGRKLGDYEIEAVQGAGGMARVYRGYDEKLDRYAAIKVIEPHLIASAEEGEYRERFLREARAIARLSHQRIVGIYQFGQLENIYYIAMEYVEGRNLREILKAYNKQKRTMPVAEMLPTLRDIADALDYAHENSIIHRDIKPSNIIITPDGSRAVLTDFGLALNAIEGTIGNTFGSVHYIAPEQAISSAQAVPQSDQYSLGIIAYEMLTGQVPFDDASAMSVALKHISDPPPPIREINPNVSESVEAVILKALDKDLEQRFENCMAFVVAMEEAFIKSGQNTLSHPPVPALEEEISKPEETWTLSELNVNEDAPTVTDTDSRPSAALIKAREEKQPRPEDTVDVPPYNPDTPYKPLLDNADTVKPPVQMNLLKEKLAAVQTGQGEAKEEIKSERGAPVLLFAALAVVIVLVIGGVLLLPSLLNNTTSEDATQTAEAIVQAALAATDEAATLAAQALITDEVPAATEAIPTATDIVPADTDESPTTETEVVPTDTDEPATTTDIPPTETEVVPTETDEPATTTDIPPTETDEPPAATDEPPTNTPEAVIGTPVLRASAEDPAMFLLNYTGEGLMLYNRTDMVLDVPSLQFVLLRPEASGEPTVLRQFSAREWFNGLAQMPLGAEECMQVTPLEIVDIPASRRPANICERRNFIRSTSRAFWIVRDGDETTTEDAYFEVRLEDEVVATCPTVNFQDNTLLRCRINLSDLATEGE